MDKQRKFWVWALLFFVLESILAAVVSLLLNFPLLDTFAYSSFLLLHSVYLPFHRAMPGLIM
ncbi:hypothetical protein [Bacillus sp. 22-7]|uniref:hypothetical protein n=1 Tax=Bacillus sp. 22-7 TaxID=2709707 RepID=UPI002570200C|nr:hypothetical protein [Bacillus sp. 22-7]